jgi:hypothetical protein
MVKSVSWPMPVTTGIGCSGDGARDALVVEGPQVLERAAAAGEDQHVALGARAAEIERRGRSPNAAAPCTGTG